MKVIGSKSPAVLFICALALLILILLPTAVLAKSYSVKTLHFDVVVGPDNDKHCDIVGDLYRPQQASKKNKKPAILTTHGFGGSKDDQKKIAASGAKRGYVVLGYSGLGFGGSGCKIELDDRDWDGKAAKQLISFLGGGMKAKDGTRVNYVKLDNRAGNGKKYKNDPRVGMVGGSYGGQVQFAAAALDPRLDTIVPIITWNDLAYSLVPNSVDFKTGVSSQTAGVPKFIWAAAFFGLGIARGLQGSQDDPERIVGSLCPNFNDRVCSAFIKNALLNAPDKETIDLLRHASVSTFTNRIKIPTLLIQGEADTLFNLNESVATYKALRKNKVPVKLLWQSWGHSSLSTPKGELDQAHPYKSYEGRVVFNWMNHYLKDKGSPPRMNFCFFRDWTNTNIQLDATDAYQCKDRYPGVKKKRAYLSGENGLVENKNNSVSGSSSFVAPAEVPTSFSEISALDQSLEIVDAPGTFAAFTSSPLKKNLEVAGIPKLRLDIEAPLSSSTQEGSPSTQAVLFVKLIDLDQSNKKVLPHRLLSPVRLPKSGVLTVELPGIVHRFNKGHRIQVVVSGSDAAYRGNIISQPITINTSASAPGFLELPVISRVQANKAL